MIKPFPRSLLRPESGRLRKRRITVTVCVAAICGGNILIGASDRMLTAGDVEFEPETQKIYSLSNSTVVMIAGEASLQTEILQLLYKFVAERIKEKPQEWIPIGDVANEYQSIYQGIKSRKAEMRILRPMGLTLDTFIQRQKDMSSPLVADLTKEIVNFEMPPIEAIVSGVDGIGAHIYVVNNSEVTCRDAIGFAAIGAGYWHANSQFMFAGHNRNRPLPETLLLTYAAKRRAEVAPGVGVGTDMFSMGPNPGTYGPIIAPIIKDLGNIYKHTRDRAAQSLRKSNNEVTKYVEQLGQAATAQQQKNPTPTPSEKTNGAEPAGEEDTGTAKPN
jgi:hypothetical protein